MSAPGARIGDLLREAERALAGTGSARVDAEVLLVGLLDRGREWLYAHADETLPDTTACDYLALIRHRRAGFPVAYLTGRREFWSLDLLVDRHTLIPRPETEGVVEAALGLIADRAGAEVLDLGTGSGAIALALASARPDVRVTAIDLSAEALAVARRNAARLAPGRIEFVHCDWFSGIGSRRFDLIACNPPYVDTLDPALIEDPIRHEPRLALDGGHAGMQAIAAVIASACRHLQCGGALVLEHGATQGEAARRLLAHAGFTRIETRRDLAGRERVSLGTRE